MGADSEIEEGLELDAAISHAWCFEAEGETVIGGGRIAIEVWRSEISVSRIGNVVVRNELIESLVEPSRVAFHRLA